MHEEHYGRAGRPARLSDCAETVEVSRKSYNIHPWFETIRRDCDSLLLYIGDIEET